MKRPCEGSSSEDSDMDETIDVGSENVYHGHSNGSFIRCGSPTTTTQVMARKKRRGIIEKRRRDRINNSLSELRRLVPTAFEKQGSAKLEKAEILQMTVDHLKMLQATGGKGYFDAHALALDFLSLGFRECVTEVSRYLSSMEGLDPSDPLHVRLLSHLASCASQRDTAAAVTSSMTSPMTGLPPHHHHPHLTSTPLHHFHPHHWAAAAAIATATTFHPLPFGLNGLPGSPESIAVIGGGGGAAPQRLGEVSQHLLLSACSSSSPHTADSSSTTSSSSSSTSPTSSHSTHRAPSSAPANLSSASLLSLSAQLLPLGAFGGGYPALLPHASLTSSSSAASPPISSSSSSSTPQSSSKPYRPWGTEVGAF